jgi:hypothetical protein
VSISYKFSPKVVAKIKNRYSPLQIVWPRILVIPLWAKWAHVAGGFMDEAMPDHLVFALESLSSFTARTSWHRAIMGAS